MLNVVLIPNAPRFGASRLTHVGQTVAYAGFTTSFDRQNQRFMETSNGGVLKVSAITNHVAAIDWSPYPAKLRIERGGEHP